MAPAQGTDAGFVTPQPVTPIGIWSGNDAGSSRSPFLLLHPDDVIDAVVMHDVIIPAADDHIRAE